VVAVVLLLLLCGGCCVLDCVIGCLFVCVSRTFQIKFDTVKNSRAS